MKIVQINATYGKGSTGAIARDIHQFLEESGHESYVFWATGCTQDGRGDTHVIRIGNDLDHKLHALKWRLFKNQGWNSNIATKLLCRKLEQIRPDVVHLHNLHSNYINFSILMDFLNKNDISVAITLHDCWFFTGHCTYFTQYHCNQWREGGCKNCPAAEYTERKKQFYEQWRRKGQLFSGNQRLGIIGVSEWISNCGKASLLKSAKTQRCIYNWIDNKLFSPKQNTSLVRKKYQIKENEKIILGVSQGWSERKGLQEFQKLAEEMKGKAKILLVGEHEGLESSENLVFCGFTSSREELANLYSAADILVNPSRMETYGLVMAEAMACGTPVIAYDNTAIHEIVTDQCGYLVPDGDDNKLIEIVKSYFEGSIPSIDNQKCIIWVQNQFNKKTQIEKYIKIYKELRK